jgi:hypothetical protein
MDQSMKDISCTPSNYSIPHGFKKSPQPVGVPFLTSGCPSHANLARGGQPICSSSASLFTHRPPRCSLTVHLARVAVVAERVGKGKRAEVAMVGDGGDGCGGAEWSW